MLDRATLPGLARSGTKHGGQFGSSWSRDIQNRKLTEQLAALSLTHSQRFFDRRVERLVWSPSSRSTLAVGSHGGDVMLWNYEDETRTTKVVDGCGKGGAVNDMAFADQGSVLYVVGHEGFVCRHDCMVGAATQKFHTSALGSAPRPGFCCDHWFTSLSLAPDVVLASCNLGSVTFLDHNCKLAARHVLHKSKVSHVELNPRDPNTFVTSSVDRTCKLWDRRKISDKAEPLHTITCGGVATAAHFSYNGARLLVTSQDNTVSLYQVSGTTDGVSLLSCHHPGWEGAALHVPHPHRFYQHLTQFRATWHPSSDSLFVIGRFPDKEADGLEAERGIDVYDVLSTRWSLRVGTVWPGIQSGGVAIREDGEAMASMSGHTALIYTPASLASAPCSDSAAVGEQGSKKRSGGKGEDGGGNNAASKRVSKRSAAAATQKESKAKAGKKPRKG